MPFLLRVAASGLTLLTSAGLVLAQPSAETPGTVPNWAAPHYWNLPKAEVAKGTAETDAAIQPQSTEAVPTSPLALVGITPCRLADTRGNGFSGAYGPPALAQGSPRNFAMVGPCGIPPGVEAISLNITVTNTQGPGFILIYPQGGSQPTVSTLNYVAGQTVANAAVVPLGTGGGVTIIAGVSGTDLIIDTNGYYAHQSVVNTVNNLSGTVTLAAGTNVSITPSGQTLTVASNGGPGGLLPTGTSGQTLRHNGTSWVANDALRNDGTDVSLSGVLRLPASARATAGTGTILHNSGDAVTNIFLGIDAGLSVEGNAHQDTGCGPSALKSLIAGSANSALGWMAIAGNFSGSDNTATGAFSLRTNQFGSNNTAVGAGALANDLTGSGNTALGQGAGGTLTSGSNNLYIGNEGVDSESNTIRVGSGGVTPHTRMFVAGVLNSTVTGASVLISGTGQLGIPTSSARFKDDIADMADASSALLKLRPVTFRYKGHADHPLQYGLIAEEVEKVLPELVLNDSTGQPQTVLYHELPAMLVNELQKQEKRIEQEDAEIAVLRQQLQAMQKRLSELSTK